MHLRLTRKPTANVVEYLNIPFIQSDDIRLGDVCVHLLEVTGAARRDRIEIVYRPKTKQIFRCWEGEYLDYQPKMDELADGHLSAEVVIGSC